MNTNPIRCPRCNEYKLWKISSGKSGKEFYCVGCNVDFGIVELVIQWNYDAGDFFDAPESIYSPMSHLTYYSEFSGGELQWETLYERSDAYKMVDRMFMGISEIDDYSDLLATQMGALT